MTGRPGRTEPAGPAGAPRPAGWLPRPAEEVFGQGASAGEAYGLLTADVPAERWIPALEAARDELGCTYFDWLSAVDEPGTGILVCAHVVALGTPLRRLLLRTAVPHEAPVLPTATGVYAGAAWHERETREMFGVSFEGHPHPAPLLLPEGFEGHPLRKDFVLAARVAKAWPGAKEPGESAGGGPRRRRLLPPGVPDPDEWGPLKGRVPPAARPSRERPLRRDRSAGAGSASRGTGTEPGGRGADAPWHASEPAPRPRRPRRNRSVSEGSASQRATDRPPEDGRPERPGEEAGGNGDGGTTGGEDA